MSKRNRQPGKRPSLLRRLVTGVLRYLLGLVCTVVVLLIALYLREVWLLSRFEPTGDALFDRYGRTVLRRQCWRLMWRNFEGDPLVTSLPDEVLAGWEDEFGDDPRYWQLRYWCSTGQIGTGLFVNEPRFDEENCRYLRMGIERTGGDVQSYCGYANSLDPAETDVLHGTGIHPEDTEQAEHMLAVLDDAVAALPDEAWPHYLRAFLHWRMDNQQAALSDLKAGNQAKKNAWPLTIYPASFVKQRMLQNELPGNPVLCGAILAESAATDLFPPYLKLKWMRQEASEVVCQTGDIELLTEYHVFLCRMWNSKGADRFSMMCAAGYDRKLLTEVLCDPHFQPTTEQHKQLVLGTSRTTRLISWLDERPDPGDNLLRSYDYKTCLLDNIGLPYEISNAYAKDWINYQFWLNGRAVEFHEMLVDLDLNLEWEQPENSPE